ncbi:response regulator transcription factor [Kineosporia succinea]|uniref:Two-component system OmpR family response regulator n=1 Tax=Kineosporia succinea TaxID=84632 RepID=A0ABT9PF26_9ACTN|nr:response regulator transcription factor [Kineosporia succinea]MDP9830775.1 two-component system OmpR family response regulator [Kineosporia succinea]
MSSPDRILVVDDDAGIRDLLTSALEFAGFAVTAAADVTGALRIITAGEVDVLVLDVMLPGADGFDLVQLLRSRGTQLPVLLLTARDAVEDRVRGLRLGADDYVTKPFSVAEVVARVEALRRRSLASVVVAGAAAGLRVADLELDEDAHRVTRGGDLVQLSPTEFRLLRYLLLNSGRVVSKSQILQHVWQYDFGGDAGVVERFVSNLRRKLDDGREPLIHTVRGFGYSLREPSR